MFKIFKHILNLFWLDYSRSEFIRQQSLPTNTMENIPDINPLDDPVGIHVAPSKPARYNSDPGNTTEIKVESMLKSNMTQLSISNIKPPRPISRESTYVNENNNPFRKLLKTDP